MIEILSSGGGNSVQDMGRPFYLDQGVGRGGTMDRSALELANLLVGNEADQAALEIAMFPFRLRFHRSLWFSVTGAHCVVEINGRGLPPWWASKAAPGDELRLGPPERGARAIIAFAGGLDVPHVLNAAATDLKSAFGGLDGRGLLRGDRLAVASVPPARFRMPDGHGIDPSTLRASLGSNANTPPLRLRMMTGAEFDRFTPSSRDDFLNSDWGVSAQANRQGCRLEGPILLTDGKVDLFSHGLMPGTVQVPPYGQPIIQLAEANTCGGYPKLGTIIEPDLWMLAQSPTGTLLRFEIVTRQQGVAAIRAERAAIADIAKSLSHVVKPGRKAE